MAEGTFVAYYRVSTAKQGRSGLGLDAQKASVANFLNGGSWRLAGEFVEVESGKVSDRPQLMKAFQACKLYGAKLVIAKLDRLSRDAHFLLGLEKSGIDFVAVDMPFANRLTVGIMALVADEERRMISARTKAALAQKRAFYDRLTDEEKAVLLAEGRAISLGGYRGVPLPPDATEKSARARRQVAASRAELIAPAIAEIRASGVTSLNGIARALTERHIPTARGEATWTAMQVKRALALAGALAASSQMARGYVGS